MQMREYLLSTFRYNDATNRKLIDKIRSLPDKERSIRYFSHLINSQYKWMARINQDPKAPGMSWWDPVYELEHLEIEWERSLSLCVNFIEGLTEEQLFEEVIFTGFDGAKWAATPVDIALQLNYHSIHHRAQIQTLIREQGIEPDFVDYIGTKYRRID